MRSFISGSGAWFSRQIRPKRIAFVVVVFLVLAGLGAATVSLLQFGRPEDDRREAGKEEAKPVVETRYLSTGLLDLKLTSIAVPRLIPGFQESAGALEPIEGGAVIADATGGFFRLIDDGSGKPKVDKLAVRLDVHAKEMTDLFFKKTGGKGVANPARITDLALLAGGKDIAVAYSYWDVEHACLTLRVSTMPLATLLSANENGARDWRLLFRTSPCANKLAVGHESGGRIFQSDANTLYLTVGHIGANELVTDPASDYGKVLKITLADGKSEHVSTGHRNAQGLTVDDDGRVWITEHGPRGGDELNLILPGRDYGWPRVTLGTDYSGLAWPNSPRQGRHDGFEPPVYAWMPSIATSQLIAVRNFSERWDGDLLVTSLRARSIYRLRFEGDHVLYEERIDVGDRIRDIGQAANGDILLWTDRARVLRLSVSDVGTVISAMIQGQPPAVSAALQRCAECHQFGPFLNDEQLTLWSLYGRRAGQGQNKKLYSDAMRSVVKNGKIWDDANLDQFLANPKKVVPGTSMEFEGIADAETRRGVISFLATLK